jgi:hypothetical protein
MFLLPVSCKYVFSSTLAEGFRLDGGLEREAVGHILHLQEDVLHLLAVGKELFRFTVHLNGHDTAVLALFGLDARLEVLHHNR